MHGQLQDPARGALQRYALLALVQGRQRQRLGLGPARLAHQRQQPLGRLAHDLPHGQAREPQIGRTHITRNIGDIKRHKTVGAERKNGGELIAAFLQALDQQAHQLEQGLDVGRRVRAHHHRWRIAGKVFKQTAHGLHGQRACLQLVVELVFKGLLLACICLPKARM